jgi:fatty aldehyde-generating acyl-ACP reductase
MQNKVAFIMHPLNVSEFRNKIYFYSPFDSIVDFFLRILSPNFVKKFFASLPPHSFMNVGNFKSSKQSVVDITGVMCPMFPEEVVFNKMNALNKVFRAVKYAIHRGSSVVVLAGFTSIIGNQGQEIKSRLEEGQKDVVLTSGNSLTAALTLKGIKKALDVLNVKLNDLTTVVIGATGDIGSICSEALALDSKEIILCSRTVDVNHELFKKIYQEKGHKVSIEKNIAKAISRADLIVITTSSFIPLVDLHEVKPRTIICDVSLPYNVSNISGAQRRDVFVFDGGKARLPKCNSNNSKWLTFNKNYESIPGCLAEGLLLALENQKTDFSIGRGNITKDKIDFILNLADSHGFDVSNFAFHEEPYSEEDISDFKRVFESVKIK